MSAWRFVVWFDDVAKFADVVYEGRPGPSPAPVLDQVGVVPALAQQLQSLRRDDGAPMTGRLDASPFPSLPTAVEGAVYRIATEAVANASRHSSATRLLVTLRQRTAASGDDLVLEITDDGTVVNGQWRPGVGLTAMRERADELGGSCEAGRTAGTAARVTGRGSRWSRLLLTVPRRSARLSSTDPTYSGPGHPVVSASLPQLDRAGGRSGCKPLTSGLLG